MDGGSVLRRGMFLRRLGFTWEVALLKDGVIHLRNTDTGETDKLTIAQWQEECLSGDIRHIATPGAELNASAQEVLRVPLADLPETVRASVHYKMAYVEAFNEPARFYRERLPDVPVERRVLDVRLSKAKLTPFLRDVAAARGHDRPPAFSTFCEWLATWRTANAAGCADARVLASRFDKRGPKQRFMDARVEEWLNEEIDRVWLHRNMPRKKEVHEALRNRIEDWNKAHPGHPPLQVVSERQVCRYIDEEVDQYVVACRRRGKEWADRHFRPVGRGPEPDKILDIVEADHSRAHVAVIDDVSGVNLGRPWVTVALDRYSRLPLAVHVHFDGQSLTAVMQALRQTMLPKDFLKELFPDLRLAYGASGVPVAYFFDRGSDFDNDHIVDVGFTFDIRMDYAPVGCPEFKGRIERFFRTMHAEVAHPLPGATPPLLVDSNAREGQVNLR